MIQEACRFCLTEAGGSLYYRLDSLPYLELVTQCFNLGTDLLDYSVLPRHVCDECNLVFNRFIKLRNIAKENDLFVSEWQNKIQNHGVKEALDASKNAVYESTKNNTDMNSGNEKKQNQNIEVSKIADNDFMIKSVTSTIGVHIGLEEFSSDTIPADSIPNERSSDVTGKEKQLHLNDEIDPYEEIAKIDEVAKEIANIDENIIKSEPDYSTEMLICKICGKAFGAPNQLRNHSQTHTYGMVKCPHCVPDKFMRGFALRKHLRNVHQLMKDIPCEYDGCGKMFKQSFTMRHHVKLVHLKDFILCNLCGSSVRNMHYHKQTCNKNNTYENMCKICEKGFSCKVALETHMETIHGGNTTTTCELCGKEVKNMKSHLKHKHADNMTKISCEQPDCQALFKSKTAAVKHLKGVHLGEKQQCHICHEWLKNLPSHLQVTHQQGKKHICDDCGKIFFKACDLQVHVDRVHLGTSKRFSCPECGKSVVKIKEHIKSVHGTDVMEI